MTIKQIQQASKDAEDRFLAAKNARNVVIDRLKIEAGKLLIEERVKSNHSGSQIAAVIGISHQQFQEMEGLGVKKRYTVERIIDATLAVKAIDWSKIQKVKKGRLKSRCDEPKSSAFSGNL